MSLCDDRGGVGKVSSGRKGVNAKVGDDVWVMSRMHSNDCDGGGCEPCGGSEDGNDDGGEGSGRDVGCADGGSGGSDAGDESDECARGGGRDAGDEGDGGAEGGRGGMEVVVVG